MSYSYKFFALFYESLLTSKGIKRKKIKRLPIYMQSCYVYCEEIKVSLNDKHQNSALHTQ